MSVLHVGYGDMGEERGEFLSENPVYFARVFGGCDKFCRYQRFMTLYLFLGRFGGLKQLFDTFWLCCTLICM